MQSPIWQKYVQYIRHKLPIDAQDKADNKQISLARRHLYKLQAVTRQLKLYRRDASKSL